MQLIFEILISGVLVIVGVLLIGRVKKTKRLKKKTMIPIKKENKKVRTLILLVILAVLIIGVGILVNNGTVVLKW